MLQKKSIEDQTPVFLNVIDFHKGLDLKNPNMDMLAHEHDVIAIYWKKSTVGQ